jgi:hypothetical protein
MSSYGLDLTAFRKNTPSRYEHSMLLRSRPQGLGAETLATLRSCEMERLVRVFYKTETWVKGS